MKQTDSYTVEKLKRLVDVASGRKPADLVIKNVNVVDVFTPSIIEGDIAIADGLIAGVGAYSGEIEVNASGLYASPGLIDSHIHVESSYVSPSVLGDLLLPYGTTTILADPHEIVNISGITGFNWMKKSAIMTPLDICFELPSCVPSTPFENAGAIIDSASIKEYLAVQGCDWLGEFMNFIGVVNGDDECLAKIVSAKNAGVWVDGHAPGLSGNLLNAYASCGILGDHECSTIEEMKEHISRGMYVMLREGSACHNLPELIKGITPANSRYCLFASDDRQVHTIREFGHIDNHLRLCVEAGIDPLISIQMATINAATAFGLRDRGAIAPGKRADICLFKDLKNFHVAKTFVEGKLVAENGGVLKESQKVSIDEVKGSFNVRDFSNEKLHIPLSSTLARTIKVLPGGVATGNEICNVSCKDGEFIFDNSIDVAKICVVERHAGTGNVGVGLISGYGIKRGAIAVSIAHDSHNIICVGTNDDDMEIAINAIISQEGGMVCVCDGNVLEQLSMPIAGIMSNENADIVEQKLDAMHKCAHENLGVSPDIEPIMTLTFMALPVIPELKLTDMGLFDVNAFKFVETSVK